MDWGNERGALSPASHFPLLCTVLCVRTKSVCARARTQVVSLRLQFNSTLQVFCCCLLVRKQRGSNKIEKTASARIPMRFIEAFSRRNIVVVFVITMWNGFTCAASWRKTSCRLGYVLNLQYSRNFMLSDIIIELLLYEC